MVRASLPVAVVCVALCLIPVLPAALAQPTPVPGAELNDDGLVGPGDLQPFQRPRPSSIQPAPTPTRLAEATIDLPGEVRMDMVLIPAGSFLMGSTDDASWSWCGGCEQPVHTVNIDYDLYMGKTEVTQAQWLAVMGSWPGTAPGSTYGAGDNYPAYYISWDDCQNFITALNQLGQGTFRLPSEAEWEYACRAGTTTRFSFGNSEGCGASSEDCAAGVLPGSRSDYMWYSGNNGSCGTPEYGTKRVGGKLPNDFGLYDTHGNVWEWCEDYWHEGHDNAPADGGARESPASAYRVIRGGSWDASAGSCRSAYRSLSGPGGRADYLGLRVVRTP